MGSVIEILVLQALAHEGAGNIPPCPPPLERALTLAEPRGATSESFVAKVGRWLVYSMKPFSRS